VGGRAVDPAHAAGGATAEWGKLGL
jgi:hypothetical protein